MKRYALFTLLALFSCSIPLKGGHKKQPFWCRLEDRSKKKISSLIYEVQQGKRKRDDLDKSLRAHQEALPVEEIPLLLLAAEEDDESFRLMLQLLETGANPDIRYSYGPRKSALELATQFGSSRNVRLLLVY